MPNTPNWSIPYPASTDPPNGPAQMQALANRVDTVAQLRVVSTPSDVAAPYTGQVVFATADAMAYRYTGSAWVTLANTPTAYTARYERLTTDTVRACPNSTDTPCAWPTAVTTSPLVVASGAANQAFTVAQGLWLVLATVRLSAATPTAELSIATGSTTWSQANVRKLGGTGGLNSYVSDWVDATAAPVAVACSIFQASGGSLNQIGFGHGSSISFIKFPG